MWRKVPAALWVLYLVFTFFVSFSGRILEIDILAKHESVRNVMSALTSLPISIKIAVIMLCIFITVIMHKNLINIIDGKSKHPANRPKRGDCCRELFYFAWRYVLLTTRFLTS